MGKKKDTSGLNDSRFSRIKSDPIFAGIKNTDRKVVIDKRFAAALTDERFSSRAKVDMRGKKQKKQLGNSLLDLYELEDEGEALKSETKEDVETFFNEASDDGDVEDEEDEEEEDEMEESKNIFKKLDLARGEGNVESSSDDDSSEDGEDEEEEGEEEDNDEEGWRKSQEGMQLDLDLANLDKDAEDVEWVSKRLAVCNLEWNNINCEDILILMKSFAPEDNSVVSVGIYLSDFGLEQTALEEKNGPAVKLSKPIEEYGDNEMDAETKTAVRKYLLDRLKYYYAVVTFNNIESATNVYEKCDGFQFEETGLKMDLRFIPDDMEFEEDRVREFLNSRDVNTRKYKPKKKPKNAIANTSSKIAWDEDDPNRSRKLLEAFDGNEQAGRDLIVDSDGSDNEDNRNSLLSLLNVEEKGKKLDIDWGDGDGAKDSDSDGEYVKIDDDEEEIGIKVGKKGEDSDEGEEEDVEKKEEKKVSGYKTYLKKKKAQIAERKLTKRKDNSESNTIKTAEIVENVANDDRFKALFTDSAFAIEPSSKKFKSSLLASRQAEKKAAQNTEIPASKGPEDLVQKLKMKAEKLKKKQ